MPGADQNDVQFAKDIGSLTAEVNELTRQCSALFDKLDKIAEAHLKLDGKVSLVVEQHNSLAGDHANLHTTVEDDLKPAIQEMKDLRNKGIGIMVAVGVVVSVIGSYAGDIWEWVTKPLKHHEDSQPNSR